MRWWLGVAMTLLPGVTGLAFALAIVWGAVGKATHLVFG